MKLLTSTFPHCLSGVLQVSADGEVQLYEACVNAGITLLSIAHRPALKRFHQLIVQVDGSVLKTGKGWSLEELPAAMQHTAE